MEAVKVSIILRIAESRHELLRKRMTPTPTSTSRILIRLLIHFAGWWAFWGWLWTRDYLTFSRLVDVLAAPVTLGFFYVRYGDWQWSKWLGVAGVLVSLALIVAVGLALRYKRRWAGGLLTAQL